MTINTIPFRNLKLGYKGRFGGMGEGGEKFALPPEWWQWNAAAATVDPNSSGTLMPAFLANQLGAHPNFAIGAYGVTVGYTQEGTTGYSVAQSVESYTFPSTSILDSGSGSNATPPSGWTAFFSGSHDLERSSNQIINSSSSFGNGFYNESFSGPNMEAYATFPTVGPGGSSVAVLFANAAATAGYALFIYASGTFDLVVYPAFTIIASGSVTFGTGDSFGLSIVGTTVTAYRKPSGGSWGSIGSGTDTTYTPSNWYVGLQMSDNAYAATNVGGGNAVPGGGGPLDSQIYIPLGTQPAFGAITSTELPVRIGDGTCTDGTNIYGVTYGPSSPEAIYKWTDPTNPSSYTSNNLPANSPSLATIQGTNTLIYDSVNSCLWTNTTYDDNGTNWVYQIIKINPTTLSSTIVVADFSVGPDTNPVPSANEGLATDGTYLYLAVDINDGGNVMIYKFSCSTGAFVTSYQLPNTPDGHPTKSCQPMLYSGGYLYIGGSGWAARVPVSLASSVVADVSGLVIPNDDCALDVNGYFWIGDEETANPGSLYKIKGDMSTVTHVSLGGSQWVDGIYYDGTYIWVCTVSPTYNAGTNNFLPSNIFQYDPVGMVLVNSYTLNYNQYHMNELLFNVNSTGNLFAFSYESYPNNTNKSTVITFDPTSDSQVSVVDYIHRRETDLFDCIYNAATGQIESCYSGASFPLGYWTEQNPGSYGGDAANFPLQRGLITPADIASGAIEHPLIFGCKLVHASPTYRYPATTAAGVGTGNNIGLGTWLRLDPTLNVTSYYNPPGTTTITYWESLIFVALQKWGMFLRDTAGSLTIYGLNPINQSGSEYPSTPILDSGVGSNATPPAGWGSAQTGVGSFSLERASNIICTTSQNGFAAGAWTTSLSSIVFSNAALEVRCTLPTLPASGNIVALYFLSSLGANPNYYQMIIQPSTGTISLHTSSGVLITSVVSTVKAGDTFGMQIVDTTFQLFRTPAGSGTPIVIATVTDTTYNVTSAWYLGAGTSDVSGFTNFGGGLIGTTGQWAVANAALMGDYQPFSSGFPWSSLSVIEAPVQVT